MWVQIVTSITINFIEIFYSVEPSWTVTVNVDFETKTYHPIPMTWTQGYSHFGTERALLKRSVTIPVSKNLCSTFFSRVDYFTKIHLRTSFMNRNCTFVSKTSDVLRLFCHIWMWTSLDTQKWLHEESTNLNFESHFFSGVL